MTADHREQKVKSIDSDLSPPEQVQQAVNCLPESSENISSGLKYSFRRWTILDYSRAYSSRQITPREVCSSCITLLSPIFRIPSNVFCIFFMQFRVPARK